MNFPSYMKFNLGKVAITTNAFCALKPNDVQSALSRHASGDWVDSVEQDRQEDELNMKNGLRLLSVYQDRAGVKFYIISEAGRSSTCMLWPEDY